MSRKDKKAIINAIRIYNNKLVWVDNRGATHFEIKEPCKTSETPSEVVLGLLISTYIQDMRIKDIKDSCRDFARRLLEQFVVVKK